MKKENGDGVPEKDGSQAEPEELQPQRGEGSQKERSAHRDARRDSALECMWCGRTFNRTWAEYVYHRSICPASRR